MVNFGTAVPLRRQNTDGVKIFCNAFLVPIIWPSAMKFQIWHVDDRLCVVRSSSMFGQHKFILFIYRISRTVLVIAQRNVPWPIDTYFRERRRPHGPVVRRGHLHHSISPSLMHFYVNLCISYTV